MKKLPNKLSRVIFNKGNCIVKIHVNLYNTNNEFMHKDYTFNNAIYAVLNPFTYITIEKHDNDEWNKSKSVMLYDESLCSVIKGMKRILKDIYKEDIYAIKSTGETFAYQDKVKQYSQIISIIGTNNAIMLKPSVYIDENESTYEAVTMYINRTENDIQLTIDIFETLVFVLEKIDLFVYSQIMINYAISYYGAEEVVNSGKKYTPYNKIDFTQDSTVKTNFIRKGNNIFNGLKPLNQ